MKKIHSNFFELFNVLSMLCDRVVNLFSFSVRSDTVHIIPNFFSNFYNYFLDKKIYPVIKLVLISFCQNHCISYDKTVFIKSYAPYIREFL